MSDLTAIRARHVERTLYGQNICRLCDQAWPCDTARLLEEMERLQAREDERTNLGLVIGGMASGAIDIERQRADTAEADLATAKEEMEREDAESARIIQALDTRCDTAEADLARVRGLLIKAEVAIAALEDAHSDYSQLAVRNEINALLNARQTMKGD